eukprot:TRINITY_DN8111_c0_g3_i2.p1 TRINITY_DN8111_c0_g3~~TRINITY_DN8111_c0_g3_i2.p1  ORF type:complete len:333 (-),score=49.89 TRINITY_DN8111_c0_g3_i2:151-1149(-)
MAAHLDIGSIMESYPKDACPPEVMAALSSVGLSEVEKCRLIKLSFHATYILEFGGQSQALRAKAIVQLLGSQLGDKPLFRLDRPISAPSIEKASALAKEAGVRVPEVLATGTVSTWGKCIDVPFVIYEFIETETVEDEVCAPGDELRRIITGIRETLAARPLTLVDTEPIQRFNDVSEFIEYLTSLAHQVNDADLEAALQTIRLDFAGIEPKDPVLIHQDLNDGNTLCSQSEIGSSDTWKLDALIDWEGAVVADPRLAWDRGEPWSSLRLLSLVVRDRWLSVMAARGDAAAASIPRCAMAELVEDYDENLQRLLESKRVGNVKPLEELVAKS